MTDLPQQVGASVQVHGRIPSTDLASLLAFLVEAFPPIDRPDHALSWPVLKFYPDKNRLGLNTYGILRRFLRQKAMREAFRQSEASGFLRELASPPKSFTSKMGGRLFNDKTGEVSLHVTKLKHLFSDELDRLGVSPDTVLVADPEAALRQLAETTEVKAFLKEFPAKLNTMAFAKPDRPASIREKDLARLVSAEEEIQAEDWLERMANSIADVQSREDDEFDETQRDKLFATLRQDFDRNDSQVTRFLNFLEDEALSRVRLAVSFAIMQGLAVQVAQSQDPGEQAFLDYVKRVIALFNFYGAPESDHSLHLDMSRDFGLNADFPVSAELVKALFYHCLPVWAEWNTQIFESRRVDPSTLGVCVVREVSYRFRVNGKDPRSKEMLAAFDARLSRLRDTLLDTDREAIPRFRLRRSLTEIMFLWLVLNPAIHLENLQIEAETLANRLNMEGKDGVAALLDGLASWSPKVKGLSKVLVNLLRKKSHNVIAHAQRSVDDLYLVVQQGIVDWAAIERTRGKPRDPLVKPGEGQTENIEWFKYIKVARQPDEVPMSLFSVRVKTKLHERMLAMREDQSASVRVLRQLPKAMLNITWQPISVNENEAPHKPVPRIPKIHKAWRMGPGVDIGFEPEQLKFRNAYKGSYSEEDRRQYRAAAATALTVLVYVFLQVLTERIAKARGERIPALMLRFQTQGKKASSSEGDPLVYAASQAIESALMRDVPVRMQGLVDDGGDRQYKDKGASFALSSAFPLVVGADVKPMVDKIAVIIYATRPCDSHPSLGDADGFLFRVKTYLAEAVNEPFAGYRLSFDRMQSYVVETQDEFKSPKPIVEEVARLHGLGFGHIILISSHYGNRRINRSAQRHSPHTPTAFLDEVANKFSAVSLYMLRRDVFPAFRLHTRDRHESAFESVGLSDHDEFAIGTGDGLQKQLAPVFTFATLAIVGHEDARPQSGFCTYFLDTDYQVRNTEWRERIRSNILNSTSGVRECLLLVLRGLHFLEAEKQPEAGHFKPVLDPFAWVQPVSTEAAGEIEVFPSSRRKGNTLLSLPALLSHVTDALHRGR
ncbi:MAG: hypothetical protein NTX45_04825 [Proteobacteria bacterium]|nr:hypothetical protein [Pseudomonadota bacterium]